MISLSGGIDIASVQRRLDAERRATIPGLLKTSSARSIADAAANVPNWTLVTRLAGRHMDLDAHGMTQLPDAKLVEFEKRVHAEAREGFQYLYETYPLYDKAHAGTLRTEAPALAELFDWLNGEEFLDLMRSVLGVPEIGFADAQLTCYRGGHFLTTHDDAVAGKNRVAAYILSLSEGWEPHWGGQLQFFSPAGDVEAALVPRFNTLSLLKVPQPHAVLPVAPYARLPRYSITGWLRTGHDPARAPRAA